MTRQNIKDLFIQVYVTVCAWVVLSGGAFFVSRGYLKSFRDGHRALLLSLLLSCIVLSLYRYRMDKQTFFHLELFRSIKVFFELPAAISISVLCILYFSIQFFSLMSMHAGFETALYDLGLYDQIIWNTAHGHFLITSIRGGLHIFSERFKPMLALLAPIYLIGNDTSLLFIVSSLISSTCIVSVYLITKALTRSHQTALVMAICIFFYSPLRNSVNFLFHTQTFADPFLLFGFYFALRKMTKSMIACLLLALMCKESVFFDVLGIGLFFVSRRERIGWPAMILALVYLFSFVMIVEPLFRYPFVTVNKWAFYNHLFKLDPAGWKEILTPNPIGFIILVLGPFLFLSFKCKGWYWLLGPSFAFRLLSRWSNFRTITFHYTSGLNALVFISAVYGIAAFFSVTHGEKRDKWRLGFLDFIGIRNAFYLLLITSAFIFAGDPQLLRIENHLRLASMAKHQKVIRVLNEIPPEYSILTNERPSAHLTHRPNLYVFQSMFTHAPQEEIAKRPDLVIVDEERINAQEREIVRQLVAQGYTVIFEIEFLKIYEQQPPDLHPVPLTLLNRWRDITQDPVVNYHKIIQIWYTRSLLVLAGLLFLGLMMSSVVRP